RIQPPASSATGGNNCCSFGTDRAPVFTGPPASAVTRGLPSAWNATRPTASLCPPRVWSKAPLSASQTRGIDELLNELRSEWPASRLPSALNVRPFVVGTANEHCCRPVAASMIKQVFVASRARSQAYSGTTAKREKSG